jgi:hypothetical protein
MGHEWVVAVSLGEAMDFTLLSLGKWCHPDKAVNIIVFSVVFLIPMDVSDSV